MAGRATRGRSLFGVALMPFVPRADPYALPIGPTAHMPPAFAALLALLYTGFGLTMTAGYVAWLLQVAASATMVAMLP